MDVDLAGALPARYLGKLVDVNINDFLPDFNLIFNRNAVPPETVIGTNGNDILSIGNGGGTIEGLDGADRLTTSGGSPVTVRGGTGRDVLTLNDGHEICCLGK